MRKTLLAVLFGAAALLVWPSCGSNDTELRRQEAYDWIRSSVNGTWTGTTPQGDAISLALTIEPDYSKLLMRECASAGILPVAFACMTTYSLPVLGQMSSPTAKYKGQISGKAIGYGKGTPSELTLSGLMPFFCSADRDTCVATLGEGPTAVSATLSRTLK